jgi:pimeloyl-ACP methyl ester carboxylesterase
MGHSWGGSIITGFAARYPDRVEGLAFVDSGQMDYKDSPNFPHGKSLEDLIADARESRVRAPKEDFEQAAKEGLRRPVTPELLEAVRAGFREEDGELVGIVTPEVRGAVLHGITKMRVTENWPAIAEAGIPILLLLATEPQETWAINERALPAFRDRFPDAEIHLIEGAGHDLIADAGPEVARLVRDWAVAART